MLIDRLNQNRPAYVDWLSLCTDFLPKCAKRQNLTICLKKSTFRKCEYAFEAGFISPVIALVCFDLLYSSNHINAIPSASFFEALIRLFVVLCAASLAPLNESTLEVLILHYSIGTYDKRGH